MTREIFNSFGIPSFIEQEIQNAVMIEFEDFVEVFSSRDRLFVCWISKDN